MKLAVFTSKYPARIATFFERDMRALLETGLEIDVFAISPLEASAEQRAIAVRARRRTEEKYDLWRNGARLAHLLRSTRRGAPQVVPAVPELGYASPV